MRFHVGFSFRLKDLKKIIIPILIAVAVFFGLKEVNAEEVTTVSYGTKTTSVNQTSFPVTWTNNVPMVSTSTNLPIKIVDNTGTQFSNYYIKGFSLNFPSPTTGAGKSYTINATFRIYYNRLDFASNIENGLTPKLLFEKGASDVKDSSTTYTYSFKVDSTDITNLRPYAEFTVSSVVNMNNTYDFSTIYLSLFNNTEFDGSTFDNFYLMTCAMGTDGCSSTTFSATLELLDVDVTISKDLNETLLNGINNSINNQSQIIQNKFDEMFNTFDKFFGDNNQKLEDIENTITDDNVDDSNASGFFNNFEDKDHGGLSSIITSPLNLIKSFTSSTCSPVSIPILDSEIVLQCGDTLFWNRDTVSTFKNWWNIFWGGLIAYNIAKDLFFTIKNLKDPNSDKVEVLDL